MAEMDDWETWLTGEFPGFLLPASMHQAIAPEVAAQFLARLGRPDQLRVLQATALFSPPEAAEGLREFVHRLAPALAEALPSQTEVYPRRWQEGFHGRLDVQATLAERLTGNPSTFITSSRRRTYDLPETVVFKQVLLRIRRELKRLRDAGLLPSAGWSGPIDECEHRISQLVEGTALRHVMERSVDASDIAALCSARGPAFAAAARWRSRMQVAFDNPTEAETAALLARGALAPLEVETRFAIAVVLRLVGALWRAVSECEPGRWQLSQGLVCTGRQDLAMMERDDGARVEVYYDQAILAQGPRDVGASYYFGSVGRLRPDWVVGVKLPDCKPRYVVGEVKYSTDAGYQRTGFSEAVLYRFEYADEAWGWLKSVLTLPGQLIGKARAGDATIAVGWTDWVPDVVVDGVLMGVLAGGGE